MAGLLQRFFSKGYACIAAVAVVGGILIALAAPMPTYAEPPAGAGGDATVDICRSSSSNDKCNTFIDKYINPLIRVLTVLVGIIAVISFIVAGIQYASSADDPGAVTKAKQRMFNTVLGLIAYIFLFAFINYLIPGGFL